jgi:hypothetical protein
MHMAWRICVGLALVGMAALLVSVSCRWGTDLDTERVLMLPGAFPPQGLYAAHWTGNSPFLAMSVGVAVPVLLATAGMWVLVRVRR